MLPTNMRTIEIREPGSPEVLQLKEREIPAIQTNEVLVKINTLGVNGPDIIQRQGSYPPPKGASDLMGLEVSGEIIAVGEEVTRWKIGDLICALTNGGGYAEYVAIHADHCLPIPETISTEDAGGLCETYFTVWSNIFLDQTYAKDSTMLVHGGAGGIGSTAIQLGNAFEMQVFTTCSTEENMVFCERIGATQAINYRKDDFVEIIRDAGGADLIIDFVGGDYVQRNIKAANMDARIVQLAFRKGSKVDVDLMPVMLKRLTITGSTLRPRSPEFKACVASDLEKRVWPLFATGKLKTLTHKILPLEEAAKAHQMMEEGKHKGKILLSPLL